MGSRGASASSGVKTTYGSINELKSVLEKNDKKITEKASDATLLKAYAQARALSSALDGGANQVWATNQAFEAQEILLTRERKDFGKQMAIELAKIDSRYGVSGVKPYDAPVIGGNIDTIALDIAKKM